MAIQTLSNAFDLLMAQYYSLKVSYYDITIGTKTERVLKWPGDEQDDILVLVHKSNGSNELFHRHDFFFFNYAYLGNFDAISSKYQQQLTIHEGEFYAGQPFAGHAVCAHSNTDTIMVGILIKKQVFYQKFLPLLPATMKLFKFFINPEADSFSDEFIHFSVENTYIIRTLLDLIVLEYAYHRSDDSGELEPLVLSLLLQISREYKEIQIDSVANSKKSYYDILHYIEEHYQTVTLKELSAVFSYNPAYISSLLTRQTGQSFSQIILKQRMERAKLLLLGTDLTIDSISSMIGYSSTSNFYRAFHSYFHISPKQMTHGSLHP